MPASFRIGPSDHIIYSKGWGVVTDHDIVSNRDAMMKDPAFTPESSQLYDFSEVTAVEVTAAGIRELALNSPFALTARRAIVVSSDVAYGMARMYGMLSERSEHRYQIFRNREGAVAWLTGETRTMKT